METKKRRRSNYKRLERSIGLLRSAHMTAEHFKSSCDVLHADRSRIIGDLSRSGASNTDICYLSGYARALYDEVWTKVEWRLGFIDIATAQIDWPYGDKPDGSRNLPTHGAHFWKGTDKAFTPWESLDAAAKTV